MAPCAHGTPTIKLWSFDVRSGNHSIPLFRAVTSKLGKRIDLCGFPRAALDSGSLSDDSLGNSGLRGVKHSWE